MKIGKRSLCLPDSMDRSLPWPLWARIFTSRVILLSLPSAMSCLQAAFFHERDSLAQRTLPFGMGAYGLHSALVLARRVRMTDMAPSMHWRSKATAFTQAESFTIPVLSA